MVYKLFDKKPSGGAIKSIQNQQLANELHKPIIKKKTKKKQYFHNLKTTFGGADLADIQLISKFNKGIRFLLCAIDIYSKHTRVVSLKDKKSLTIVNAFQKNIR